MGDACGDLRPARAKGRAVIVLAGLVIGAAFGAGLARKRGGRGLDMLQYGAAFAIMLALIGLFLTIYLHRVLAV